MKKILRRGHIVAVLFILVIILCLPRWITNGYMKYVDWRYALPSAGTYYCEEILVSIVFDGNSVVFIYPNNVIEGMHVDYHGRMLGQDSDIIGHYKWKKYGGEIELLIERKNDYVEEGRTYVFTESP